MHVCALTLSFFFILTSFYKPLGLMWGFTPIYICKNTKCIVIMSIKPSFYIKKFMTPGTRAQALEWEEYGYNIKIY